MATVTLQIPMQEMGNTRQWLQGQMTISYDGHKELIVNGTCQTQPSSRRWEFEAYPGRTLISNHSFNAIYTFDEDVNEWTPYNLNNEYSFNSSVENGIVSPALGFEKNIATPMILRWLSYHPEFFD